MKLQQATKGTETVVTTGFEAKAAKPDDAASKDATELKLAAGGLFAAGNSRSNAITSSVKFRARRSANQLTLALAENYAQAASKPGEDTSVTVENVQGKTRYDRFLSGQFAVFGALSGLRDRFQGLDLRINFDPGFAYYFVDESKQQFWSELGYDLQYDYRRNDKVAESLALGKPVDKAEVRHSGRLFFGYQNSLNKAVTVDTGLEYLQALSNTENWRLNWTLGLNSAIGGNFSIATTFTLKYDHNPLSNVKNTDALTAVSLVYQLL